MTGFIKIVKVTNINNFIIYFKFFFSKNIFIINNGFLKNEIYLYTNIDINKYIKYILNSFISLLDIVTYDSSLLEFIKNYKTVSFLKFYNYINDIYIYIVQYNTIVNLKNFKNSSWLIRESMEFFGTICYNTIDSRNLLIDYSIKNCYLLKNVNLSAFSEFRYKLNNSIFFKKSQVIL